jgi:hypothetical protein
MTRTGPFNLGRIAVMALLVAGAWLSLATLLHAGAWDPADTLMQSARVILLIMAGVSLMMCVVAATARLLSSAAASVPDADPKP